MKLPPPTPPRLPGIEELTDVERGLVHMLMGAIIGMEPRAWAAQLLACSPGLKRYAIVAGQLVQAAERMRETLGKEGEN